MIFTVMAVMAFFAVSAFAFDPPSFSIGFKGGMTHQGIAAAAQSGTLVGVTVDAIGASDATALGEGSAAADLSANEASGQMEITAAGLLTTKAMTLTSSAVSASAMAQEGTVTDVVSSIATNNAVLSNSSMGAVCFSHGWGF